MSTNMTNSLQCVNHSRLIALCPDDDGDAAGAGRSKKKQRMTAGFGEVQGGADGAESEDIGSDDSDDADDGEEGEEDEGKCNCG